MWLGKDEYGTFIVLRGGVSGEGVSLGNYVGTFSQSGRAILRPYWDVDWKERHGRRIMDLERAERTAEPPSFFISQALDPYDWSDAIRHPS